MHNRVFVLDSHSLKKMKQAPTPRETRRFASFDGEQLRYDVYGNKGAPVMALLNGFVCTTQYWPEVIAYFSQFYTVLAWDYRGHGGTGLPKNLETCTIPCAADDLSHLLKDYGADNAVVVGHSMGSQVAFEFAKQYPDQTSSLISICGSCESPIRGPRGESTPLQLVVSSLIPRVKPYPKTLARLIKPILRTRLTQELTYRLGANRELVSSSYIEALYAHVQSLDFAVAVRFFESMINHSARDSLSRITCPLLIIGGSKDGLVSKQTIEEICSHNPRAEGKIYKDCTHLAMIEKHDEVMEDFRHFLERYEQLPT